MINKFNHNPPPPPPPPEKSKNKIKTTNKPANKTNQKKNRYQELIFEPSRFFCILIQIDVWTPTSSKSVRLIA